MSWGLHSGKGIHATPKERETHTDMLCSLDLQKYLELGVDTLDLPIASLE